MKRLDITGQKFARLTAIERVETRNALSVWRFRCDCGNFTDAYLNNIRKGNTRSCGCLGNENRAALTQDRTSHGHATGGVSPTYRSWRNARERATRSGSINYERYGGAGIGMCQPWAESFQAFLADMGERPKGMTLDRIDNKLGYQPGNCRWATPRDQVWNRRCARWVVVGDERVRLTDFARQHSITVDTVWKHIKAGLTAEEVVARVTDWKRRHVRRKALNAR